MVDILWVKECHKLPNFGMFYTTNRNGDLGDGLVLLYPH